MRSWFPSDLKTSNKPMQLPVDFASLKKVWLARKKEKTWFSFTTLCHTIPPSPKRELWVPQLSLELCFYWETFVLLKFHIQAFSQPCWQRRRIQMTAQPEHTACDEMICYDCQRMSEMRAGISRCHPHSHVGSSHTHPLFLFSTAWPLPTLIARDIFPTSSLLLSILITLVIIRDRGRR